MCIEILAWFVVFVEYQSCLFWLMLSAVVHALKVAVKMAVRMRINSVSYWFLLSINTPSRRSSSVAARRPLRQHLENLENSLGKWLRSELKFGCNVEDEIWIEELWLNWTGIIVNLRNQPSITMTLSFTVDLLHSQLSFSAVSICLVPK